MSKLSFEDKINLCEDKLKNYEINKNDLCELIKEYHKKHSLWEYRHSNLY